MNNNYIFESERLGFRLWAEDDFTPFALLGRDIEGMRFFSRTYNDDESANKMYEHIAFLEDYGYGFWAVEYKETQEFIGTIGFNHPSIHAFFTPCLQIGWCLNKNFWNQGLATEGALSSIEYLKAHHNIKEIYSYTTIENIPSLKIMQKIHMTFLQNFTFEDDEQIYCVYKLTL